MRLRIRIIGAISLFILLVSASFSSAEGVSRRVKFSKGKSAATYAGAVIRGDRDEYVANARAGQKLSVSISSIEKNAVFQIQGPRDGECLSNACETDDQTIWTGRLPDNGNYTIIVGGTRGNASYRLGIALR